MNDIFNDNTQFCLILKVQLETITSQIDRSFSLMFNPRLNDLFFWHFHPEYELVYIEGAKGNRHVGNHISSYDGSDLVLIGSNIPHLNFDYGVQTEYRKAVVHLKKEFVETHFASSPELSSIKTLVNNSSRGIAFKGVIKKTIGERLFALEHLDLFQQYLKIVEIFHLLSKEEDLEYLHPEPFLHKFRNKEQDRLRSIYAFVDKNYHRKIELNEMSELCFMSKEAFCRYFKRMTKYTFIEFLNRYRISHAKRHLMSGESVSAACYSSGFESLSYFNRIFKKVTNENPRDFRKRYW